MILKILAIIPVLVGVLTYNYFYYYHGPGRFTEGKIVQTKSGPIQGSTCRSRDGREFYQWLGVPYAEPPIGDLRFASPKPVQKREGVFDATKYGYACPQMHMGTKTYIGNEDCLHVNIYLPKLASKEPLPVMVFIHGGGFVMGAGNDYAPDYFMDEDVVLVTVNYRFGIMGFISTGDSHIRGNMGLKDQAEALRWVKANIENFGGNPNNIFLFGESAGGASVHYLLLSNTTRGLFNKAASLSGTAILPWAFSPMERTVAKTKQLAATLNCPTEDSQLLTNCLRRVEVTDLIAAFKNDVAQFTCYNPSRDGDHLPPTAEVIDDEDAFLTQTPYDVLVAGKAQKVPWMTGILRDEGLLSVWEFVRDEQALGRLEQNWDKSAQKMFSFLPPGFSQKEADAASAKLRKFYFDDKVTQGTDQEKFARYIKMYSDGLFLAGASEAATIQRQFSPVYLYFNDQPGGPNDFPTLMAELKRHTGWHPILEFLVFGVRHIVRKFVLGLPPRNDGVGHVADLEFMFPLMGIGWLPKDDKDPDYIFSKDMVKLFADFATDEKSVEFRGQKFLPLNPKDDSLNYFNINARPKIIPEPFSERADFWRSLNFFKKISTSKLLNNNNHN